MFVAAFISAFPLIPGVDTGSTLCPGCLESGQSGLGREMLDTARVTQLCADTQSWETLRREIRTMEHTRRGW